MTSEHDDTRTSAEPVDPAVVPVPVGGRIDQLEILSLLGRGGMGQVYLAQDHRLNRKVAIKFLPAVLNENRQRVERFATEARAASALNHPNIVTIFDTGESEWGPYIVMEHIRGRVLRELIREGLTLDRMLSLALQTVEAALAAHRAGILHRDLKPDNILVRDDGYVKVVDFGLARLTLEPDRTMTADGQVMGTVDYFSPEQGRGAPLDERSDVFALGLIFYQMATGRHPFAAGSALETFLAIASDPAVPPSRWNPEIPAELEALILRMLEKAAADRPATADVFETLKGLVAGSTARPAIVPAARKTSPRRVVGRDAESRLLMDAFETTEAGTGTLVSVSGEAGMGKTTLIESFLDGLANTGRRCMVGRGRSSQGLAGAEAYVPIVEVLRELAHTDRTGRVARDMRQSAPSWYALIASAPDIDGSTAPRATSPDRMKQELTDLFQVVGRDVPLILIFEDVHWAGLSTIDALVYLSDRFASMRVLVIVTYRKSEMLEREHPFVAAELNMRARGISREIKLDFLGRVEVDQYLLLAFERHRFPKEFLDEVHARTGGHPLFLADLVRYLRESDALQEVGGVWELAPSFRAIEQGLPESVRSMVERKMSSVKDEDRKILSAAAVQGDEFDSASLAAALKMDAADLEDRLTVLERVYALVILIEEDELPDRTLTSRYRFAHLLYQEYCVGLLRPTRRASICGATARCLESGYGARASEVAAKLAVLFEGAREFGRAGDYFLMASQRATSLFAHREAAVMAQRGLDAVLSLLPSAERNAQELRLRLALGGALCMTDGYASQGTIDCFSRAWEIAEALGDEAQGPAIWALWMTYTVMADTGKTRELADRLLRISANSPDLVFRLTGHYAKGLTAEVTGELTAARTHFDNLIGLGSLGTNRERMARYVVDPLISGRSVQLRVLAILGLGNLAAEQWERNRRLIDDPELDPRSVCDILISGSCYHAYLRQAADARALSEHAIALCERFDIFLERQWAVFFRGWALTEMGEVREGLEAMRSFIELITSTGFVFHHALYFGVFAEALTKAGELDEARQLITQGLALDERTGQHYFEGELYRLRGEIEAAVGERDEAEQSLTRAVEIAVAQDARLLEMRAALSLGRFLGAEGSVADAERVLKDTLSRMHAGFESLELLEARTVCQAFSQLAEGPQRSSVTGERHG